MTGSPTTNPATSLSNATAALLQQLQGSYNGNLEGSSGLNSLTVQALLQHQEDQLRATRFLLQQRQLDSLLQTMSGNNTNDNSSAPSSRSSSLLVRDPMPVSGLLGLSGASSASAAQDALTALAAARRVSAASSAAMAAADLVKAEEEQQLQDEEDDVPDEQYFQDWAAKGAKDTNSSVSKDGDGASSNEADDKTSNESFPHKLYRMLFEAEKEGLETIVSFLPSGRGFSIHKPKEFVAEIMPRYFTTRRIASFQRQLNLYGFRRISEGKEKGGYFHKDFLKGKRCRVTCIKRKSTSAAAGAATAAQTNMAASAFANNGFTSGNAAAAGAVGLSALSAAAGSLYGNGGYSDANKELLLARWAANARLGAAASLAPAPTSAAAAESLLEMTRRGLLARSAANHTSSAPELSHQDLLRNLAASMLWNNNNNNSGAQGF